MVAGAVLLGGCGGVAADPATTADDPAPPDDRLATAVVTRRDLRRTEVHAGTLSHGPARPLGGAATGTVTWLPEVGTVVQPGEVLYRVDEQPVVLLAGTVPAYRDLAPGVAEGEDVRQLEAALVAFGHATAEDLTVDTAYTSATARAVRRWQEALGVRPTGRVPLGAVVVAPDAVRVAATPDGLGAPAAPDTLQVTTTLRAVHVDLPAADRHLVAVGDPVTVELPTGDEVAGRVAEVASVAVPDAEGEPTFALTVTLDEEVTAFDEAPVEVHLTTEVAAGVLAVPVPALLALAEGGWALEVVRGDGDVGVVGVEVGAFADGWVEVRGDVAEGDRVVVAP